MNWFEERERAILKDEYDILYNAKTDIKRGITANTLKKTKDELLAVGINATASSFCTQSLILSDDNFKPGKHAYHHAGAYYVQEPSAAAPAQLLDVQQGDYVLDVCAAPGGKSAQLGAALNSLGVLVCNEFVYERAYILRNNIERMGIKNAYILNESTKNLADSFPLFFNKVLADVPCSGEGMFRKEPVALLQHSERLVLNIAALSAEILKNAAACVALGGTLVYSTCTFSSQENEMQIARFLAENSDFYLEKISVSFGREGEKRRCKDYSVNCEYLRRIYPCDGGEGHFMAKLKRKGNLNLQMLNYAKNSTNNKTVSDFMSFHFPSLQNIAIVKRGEQFYLPPPLELPIKKLKTISSGVMLGSEQKNRFVPAHSLFMAYGSECINKELLSLDDTRVERFLHGEEISAITAKNGYCSVIVDDIPLGFGKVSQATIKNHYPKGLRNLK